MHKTTYTLVEVAQLLRCHTGTLRRAILDGSLQAARLGRSYRVSHTELLKFWGARGGGELFDKAEGTPETGESVPKPAPIDEKKVKTVRPGSEEDQFTLPIK
jgi:excisionase family DNA binding protein